MVRDINIGAPKINRIPVVSLTASASVGTHDEEVVEVDATLGTVICTLPVAATHSGIKIHFKKTDASENTVVITPAGADTIDGLASVTLYSQNATVTIVGDGTGWSILYGT